MSVVNLVKTLNGYSVLEGNVEVNKISGKSGREKPLVSNKSIFFSIVRNGSTKFYHLSIHQHKVARKQ